ncbi:MAG: sigma-54-dependent Fis family transcriptional regulator [Firmicutes bacterium]|nr:sigma-54-dependent Fis family transcriptional regulator [Bacillota bacterium]
MTKKNVHILIVDDEQDYCDVMGTIFNSRGYTTESCNNGKEALEILEKKSFDIVVSDLKMPVMDGFQLLREIKSRKYSCEVIILTAFNMIEKAVEAMKAGAYTYVTKGGDPEELLLEIDKIIDIQKLKSKNETLSQKVKGNYMLESRSREYQQTLEMAKRAAQSEANILILGESGAGKEVIANYIHEQSSRKNENMVEFNCQAISESLVESELFGHEKGSFTGAEQRRKGHFEAANGGTLFLDEIGGVSTGFQSKLLTAIEKKTIYRVGSSTPISVDFRLITATNRNLQEDIENDLFRSDLFYRISTIVLEVPPLRKRKEDISLFIDYFLNMYGQEMKIEEVKMDEEVRTLLENYDYPGNIRELKNIIERLLVLSGDGHIIVDYLPTEVREAEKRADTKAVEESLYTDYTESLRAYREKAEKAYIEELISRCEGDMNKVAEVLDISRRQLYNKLTAYGLKE